jgi:hypothetical protein
MGAGPPAGAAEEAGQQARAATHGKARVPALVIQGGVDKTVAPINALYLARQFLVFNGFDAAALPQGAMLPRPGMLPLPWRSPGTVDGDYYVGRRLAARVLTIPALGHAWSGGDAAYPFFEADHQDATRIVCDFFDAH